MENFSSHPDADPNLAVIKDKAKRLKTKNEIYLNKFISQVVKENTDKMKLQNAKLTKIKDLIKSNSQFDSLGECNSNSNPIDRISSINQMPYILFGLVETIFIDEGNQQKIRENGCGILLDSSIVLVSAKNLIFDNTTFNNDHFENQSGSPSSVKFNFRLFEIEFKPLNISAKYRGYLPNSIKVIDHYTPLNLDEENISDEEKIISSWGLIKLEYPIGDFLNYVYFESNCKNYMISNNQVESITDMVSVRTLSNQELENSDIQFLECMPRERETSSSDPQKQDLSTIYDFFESYYDMNFDTNLIFLNLSPERQQNAQSEILPGVIIANYLRKFYILGLNTNTVIKINDENDKETSQVYHIAIRFTKPIADEVNSKVIEFKANYSYENKINFSFKIFKEINRSITSKTALYTLIKDNCKGLYLLLNEIQASIGKKISSEEKGLLGLDMNGNMQFIQFVFMLMWNRHSNSMIESKVIDIENLNCGIFPATEILSEILKTKENLITLNLKGNSLFSKGIKNLIKPIFNTKKILYIGKDLKCICLDNNKLTSKSIKYIRHLIKVCPQLTLLSLSHNYITGDGMKYLINSMKDKEYMEILNLGFNMLGAKSGKYLEEILKDLKNLKDLNLQSNCLTDEAAPFIKNALKLNSKLETLILSNNNFNNDCSEHLANLLSNNRSLKTLWINNNNITPCGIKVISQALSTKLVLEELNLNSTNCGDEGGFELFENLKLNKSILRLHLNCNAIGDSSIEKFGEYLQSQNLDESSTYGLEAIYLSGNVITGLGVKYMIEALMNHRSLKEINLSSNLIDDEAGEMLLCAVIANTSIVKFSIENNQTTWRENNLNIKNIRSGIQIFF